LYIDGVVMGLGLANTYMDSRGQRPLYCRPKALTPENYLDILRQHIEKNRSCVEVHPFIGVEMLLLEGLVETFPCKK